MKKSRRLSLVLTFVMILFLCSSVSVNAEELQMVSDDFMREYLVTLGCPEEYVDTLSDEKVSNMYNILICGNYEFSGLKQEVVELQDGNANARGNIPTSKLRLTIATFDNVNSLNNVQEVYVSLGYYWLQEPIVTATDALTFNWDGTLFSLNGFYAMNTSAQNLPVDSIDTPAKSASGGIGWYSRMKDPYLGMVGINGGAELLLIPKQTIKANSNLNSDMHLNYAHATVGLSLSFGISSSGPSAGVSVVSGVYDEQATYYIYH